MSRRRWKRDRLKFDAEVERIARGMRSFYVVQVGACDGTTADPIHKWIVKFGWSGLLIEPQSDAFKKLQDTYTDYPEIQLANVAVGRDSGKQTLYKLPSDDHSEDRRMLTASFRRDTSLGSRENLDEEVVEVSSFDQLFQQFDVRRVDFLQIDVEGLDAEILELFDFVRFKPLALQFEHRHLSSAERTASEERLRSHGYSIQRMRNDTGAILTHSSS